MIGWLVLLFRRAGTAPGQEAAGLLAAVAVARRPYTVAVARRPSAVAVGRG